MKIKVCHIASHINYSLYLEAIGDFLNKDKYEVGFIFLGPEIPPLYNVFAERGHQVEWIKYQTRKDLISAVFRLRKLFRKLQPEIVHTHLVDASLAGLLAAKLSGIKKRTHTRHHSTECYNYYPQGVYYDKFINSLSRRIIATTKIVEETLVERDKADPKKVRLITYGYDLSEFKSNEATRRELGERYKLKGHYPVIGVISRLVEWKGVQHIIPAVARIVREYPQTRLVLANAVGRYKTVIESLLSEHLDPSQYVLIEFEKNIFDLYKNFDIFVHVPINRDLEAFGQTYIEALYMEIPSIFTLSGVANDFIRDRKNALVVPYCDSEAIYNAINLLLRDDALRTEIVKYGKADVEARFHGNRLAAELDEFYSEL